MKRTGILSALGVAAAIGVGASSAYAANAQIDEFISGASMCTALNPCTGIGVRGDGMGGGGDTNYQLEGTEGLRLWTFGDPVFNDVRLVISFTKDATTDAFVAGGGLSFNLYGTTVNAANTHGLDGVTNYGWVTDNKPVAEIPFGLQNSGNVAYFGTDPNNPNIGPITTGGFGPGNNYLMVLDLGAMNDLTDATTCSFNTADGMPTGATNPNQACGNPNDPKLFQIQAWDIEFVNPVPVGYVVTFNLWGCSDARQGQDDCAAIGYEGDASSFGSFSHTVMWLQAGSNDIPEPLTLGLLGTGLLGLVALRRRNR